jgi:hypothetical protein
MKDHIHHLCTIKQGSLDRYECLDCGKRLRILSGIIVAQTAKEVEAYYAKKRERYLAEHAQRHDTAS